MTSYHRHQSRDSSFGSFSATRNNNDSVQGALPPESSTAESPEVRNSAGPTEDYDSMEQISTKIKKSLGDGYETGIHEIKIAWRWDLREVKARYLDRGQTVGSYLVLTGTGDNAFACSCAAYLQETWPTGPWNLPQLLENVLAHSSDSGGYSEVAEKRGNTIIQLEFRSEQATATITGEVANIIEITQQLAWLTASLRLPKPKTLRTSRISLRHTGKQKLTLVLSALEPIPSRRCWIPLFRDLVLTDGFPVPSRDEGMVGLEIPFQLMVNLNQGWYVQAYNETLFIDTIDGALIPMWRTKFSVQWHHFCCQSPPQSAEAVREIRDFCDEQQPVRELLMERFAEGRCFLGYSSLEDVRN